MDDVESHDHVVRLGLSADDLRLIKSVCAHAAYAEPWSDFGLKIGFEEAQVGAMAKRIVGVMASLHIDH